jgi:hypothetical protein
MSDITRRDVLRRLGVTLMATGVLDRVSAQEVHHLALATQTPGGGPYSPKALSDHDYRTLVRLTDFIVPVENGKPGAVAAGAAAWIDMLASENTQRGSTQGPRLDGRAMKHAAADRQRDRRSADALDLSPTGATSSGARPRYAVFGMARRMTVDAFYTSEIGIADRLPRQSAASRHSEDGDYRVCAQGSGL